MPTTADTLTAPLIAAMAFTTFFWTNLFARSSAAPQWVINLRKTGKPWACPVCMSFWIACYVLSTWVFLTAIQLYVAANLSSSYVLLSILIVVRELLVVFYTISALAALSLIGVAVQERLDTIIIG